MFDKDSVSPMFIFKSSKIAIMAAGIVVASVQMASAAGSEAKPADKPAAKQDLACLAMPAKATDAELGAFMAAPGTLLDKNPTGGLPMSNQVRSLSASSEKAFDAIVGLIPTANKSQKSAIGAGLARAIAACRDSNPEFGDKMSLKIAQLSDADMLVGFNSANNDIATAAVPGSGGVFTGGGSTTGDTTGQRVSNSTTFGGNQSRAADALTFNAISPNAVDDVASNTTSTGTSPF